MKSIDIAVLSDQHIDTELAPKSWKRAKQAFEAAAEADHVVLAGDIFDSAGAMERDCAKVRKYLKKLGLWARDRLSIVPGNHDIFHTPHHGSVLERLGEAARTGDAAESYAQFCSWAGELVHAKDRLATDDLYPFVKKLGHVRLWAVDTTSSVVATSANGFWPAEDDGLLRANAEEANERRIVVMHHPPYKDDEVDIGTAIDMVKSVFNGAGAEMPFGFPKAEFLRLRKFIVDAEVDAVACGHLHDPGDDEWEWTIDKTECPAFLVGRTGGMDDMPATFSMLTIPASGEVKRRDVEF